MRRARGFTLLEVMIGLAILAFALVVLVRSAATSMGGAFDAELMGVATTLSRSKMNDIEEILLKDGFTETDQSLGECGEPNMKPGVATATGGGADVERDPDAISKSIDDLHAAIRERAKSGKTFEDEGWPKFSYTYRIEAVELPPWEQLQEMTKARQEGSGSGSGSDGEGGFENSTLGGMMSQFGGFGGPAGGDIDAMQGASLIQGQYALFQQILKDSLRKVTLCVYYEASGWPIELKTVAYFTDASAMDKALQGLGAQELPETDGGTGSGSGSGSGSGTRTPTGSGSGRGGR